MLHLQTFTFNAFSENTYVLYNDQQQCWVVDPGMYGPEEQIILKDFLKAKNLQPQAIINTHAHIDHILGVQWMADTYGIPFYLHGREQPVLDGAMSSAIYFGFDFKRITAPVSYYTMHQPLKLANDELNLFFTPGHSPGSVSLYYAAGRWVVAGDALFNGSIGRTDLPGGDQGTLIRSIKEQLFTLPDDTEVHPGHGPSTTIGAEKQSNPYVGGV